MFPAPTTTAISTPRSDTAWIWPLIRSTRSGSVPYCSEPMSASPESFSRMRLKTASALGIPRSLFGGTHEEAGEAGDLDVLAGPGRQFLAELLDRLAIVLVGVHVLLVEQGDVLGPLGELALDDPLDDVVGLALLASLLRVDLALRLLLLLRDLLGGDDARIRRCDVQGDLVGEGLEVLVARDEIRLALDLHHRADLLVGVDVARDDALRGTPAGALGGRRLSLHAEDLNGLVHVALGLCER